MVWLTPLLHLRSPSQLSHKKSLPHPNEIVYPTSGGKQGREQGKYRMEIRPKIDKKAIRTKPDNTNIISLLTAKTMGYFSND